MPLASPRVSAWRRAGRRGGGWGPCAFALLAGAGALLPVSALAGPTRYVRPLAGTEPGAHTFGGGHAYPGAALPFGMVQLSPDTSPADRHSGGYDYRDHHIKGFSLTHLNGAGCSLYGDFPLIPTVRSLERSPAPHGAPGLDAAYRPGFTHAHEAASPGRYEVLLDPASRRAIDAELSATQRTGLATFRFPRSRHASVLINAGGSARANDSAAVEIDPARREITGSASSGYFCAQRPRYRIYFAARFDRGFGSFGTWHRQDLQPGSLSASDRKRPSTQPARTAQAGAYATFDTRRDSKVSVQVGVSFVSVEGARRNLAAETRGFGLGREEAAARGRWNRMLARVRVSGGATDNVRTFYTALYRTFLAPRTFDDVDGRYPGMDGRLHRASGRTQYADISGWDIYRSEIQLVSLLAPGAGNDIVRSLLADAAQSGCLPRWSYANGQSMTMVGDSADPIIASAAAFGADRFDHRAALAAMLKGAGEECRSANGDYLERQGLSAYESLGYVPFDLDVKRRNANSLYGDPDHVWASAATTLEYATDDFSIAQFAARSLDDTASYRSYMRRSGAWRKLFNPVSRHIEPRLSGGSFLPQYDNLRGAGFVEGNSEQYTWMVPHDPAGLFERMGSRTVATRRLDRFLRQLNGSGGGAHTSHALLGNEPNLNVPWLYDWSRRPWKTQAAVRRALLRLYSTEPDGYPGNDDLGELSSWYVFGALGLYPEIPGTGVLAIGSPLFRHASARIGPHHRLRITAAGASARHPYIQDLRVHGRPYGRPWISYCALLGLNSLDFTLGGKVDRSWGSGASALPPSWGPGHRPPQRACAP